jgi:hypothetical protein
MDLKRYRQTASGAVFGDENGRWCFYEDAAAEIARLKARVAELEKFEASMRCPNCDNLRLEIGQLRRRVAELEAMLHDIIDSIPSTYDEEDPTVKRHAAALNVAWNSLKEVGHDG